MGREVFRVCHTRKRPRGRPRTCCRDYVSWLTWECLGIPLEDDDDDDNDLLQSVRVTILTPVHHPKLLQWTAEYQNWTMEQWEKEAWSDQSRFLLNHVDGRVRVSHLP
ncbi:hypothetical protein QTP86_028141, partial [Hemibagrus guttatus]